MALNKAQLAAQLKQAHLDIMTPAGNPSATQMAQIEMLTNAYADAIDAFVKQAQVVYTGGLTATADGDPVVGTINHTIQ